MTRFLITYHGGGMPESDEGRRQAMAAFGAWVAATGDALIDPGAPLGPRRTVGAETVVDGDPHGEPAGYSVIEAADLDAAVELVRSHPFIARGGQLQVIQSVAP